MYTKQDLIQNIKYMGLAPNDAVMVHSSMKSIGPVEGDADCILCDAKKIYETCVKLFSIEANCVIDREEIPREWWKE